MEKFFTLLNIPYDKALHALSYGMVTFTLLSLAVPSVYALVVVVFTAVAKEVYDYFHQDIHTVDVMDGVATALMPAVLVFLKWLFLVLGINKIFGGLL